MRTRDRWAPDRWAPAVAVLTVAALLAGCGEEGRVRDASDSTSVISGAKERLADTGVEVISADTPNSASVGQTRAALSAAGLTATSPDLAGFAPLADDVAHAGGLVGALAPPAGAFTGTPYVVLVFETPTPAILFAESDPQVFADAGASPVTGALNGNLLAYSASPGLLDKLINALKIDGPGSG